MAVEYLPISVVFAVSSFLIFSVIFTWVLAIINRSSKRSRARYWRINKGPVWFNAASVPDFGRIWKMASNLRWLSRVTLIMIVSALTLLSFKIVDWTEWISENLDSENMGTVIVKFTAYTWRFLITGATFFLIIAILVFIFTSVLATFFVVIMKIFQYIKNN